MLKEYSSILSWKGDLMLNDWLSMHHLAHWSRCGSWFLSDATVKGITAFRAGITKFLIATGDVVAG